jgi:zinc-binding alcohol dehydrogenase family protein
MKAVAYQKSLPISDEQALCDVSLPEPLPGPRDLLVDVKAVAVNPVDTKIRLRAQPEAGQWKVLGWDAAGVVHAVGSAVTLFKPGDSVWYSGALTRPGTNSERHVVDEGLVGRKPTSLNFAAAAALPLTTLTAWEMLFDRLGIPQNPAPGQTQPNGQSLLIVGAAGGVGSIMVQLARRLTGLQVIGTASRPQSQQWLHDLGAHHVIDHRQPLTEEFKRAALPAPDYVVSLTQTDQHFAHIAELMAPQGKFGLIDDPAPGTLDVSLLKRKSISLHWEFMFTRSLFETPDMVAQHHVLTQVADLVDAGILRSTLAEQFGLINATHLKRAHALLESGQARGKIVLEGF